MEESLRYAKAHVYTPDGPRGPYNAEDIEYWWAFGLIPAAWGVRIEPEEQWAKIEAHPEFQKCNEYLIEGVRKAEEGGYRERNGPPTDRQLLYLEFLAPPVDITLVDSYWAGKLIDSMQGYHPNKRAEWDELKKVTPLNPQPRAKPAPRPAAAPAKPTAKIIKKSEFIGAGALVQLVGLVLCFLLFPIGLIAGIILLVVGGRMAIVTQCSDCRGKVDKAAKVCPHCRAQFVPGK